MVFLAIALLVLMGRTAPKKIPGELDQSSRSESRRILVPDSFVGGAVCGFVLVSWCVFRFVMCSAGVICLRRLDALGWDAKYEGESEVERCKIEASNRSVYIRQLKLGL